VVFPARAFCDTSFFYACLDPRDTNHEHAKELISEAADGGSDFYATWDIISETVTLLRYRAGYQIALTYLDDVKPALRVVGYGDAVRAEAEAIFRMYASDHQLSFCDAVSFVVVTTLLEHMPCVAFDEDFRALGLTVIP
jgi:predicted nucleic acid-binding protein